jgi:hypothetical protein
MRTRSFSILVMLLVFIMTAVALGNSPVSAEPCTIQPNSLAYVTPNYNYYTTGVIVPVSATCSFVGGQLYAVGDATDSSTSAHVGSAPIAKLYAAYGTNIYAGQLVFTIPPQATGHPLQISISIYNEVYGFYNGYSNAPALTSTVETVQVNSNNYYYNYNNCYYNSNCGFTSPGNNYMGNNNLVKCPSPSNNNQVQCFGYLYQDPSSCVILVIPVYSSIGLLSYQYYTLQKLPSTFPPIGTWVSVTGELNQGNNYSSTGAGCPGNYINVASIS